MTLRLDTYPEAQIAAQMIPQNPPAAMPTVCCLLHTGPLPPSQQVEVWIEGAQQIPQQEGTQQVFSWTCPQQCEMSIHLKQHGRLTKSWRGWWQGDSTIAHTGTLPIQVYCAGVLQPSGLASSQVMPTGAGALLSRPPDQHNGLHHDEEAAVSTWEAVSAPTHAAPSPTEDASADEDLWEQARQDALPGETEQAETAPRPVREPWEEAPEAAEDCSQSSKVEEPTSSWRQPPPTEQETPTKQAESVDMAVPAGTMLASFAAATVWSQAAHQEQETRLAEVLAAMPAGTILVDLRHHTPTPRRGARSQKVSSGPQKLGLSKELLRNQYGARYWDRGATIQTSRRLLSTPPPTWGRVLSNPDDPDGLGTLVTALMHGCSLVVLDGEPNYAESARAAVCLELRQRVANVTMGSCS